MLSGNMKSNKNALFFANIAPFLNKFPEDMNMTFEFKFQYCKIFGIVIIDKWLQEKCKGL